MSIHGQYIRQTAAVLLACGITAGPLTGVAAPARPVSAQTPAVQSPSDAVKQRLQPIRQIPFAMSSTSPTRANTSPANTITTPIRCGACAPGMTTRTAPIGCNPMPTLPLPQNLRGLRYT